MFITNQIVIYNNFFYKIDFFRYFFFKNSQKSFFKINFFTFLKCILIFTFLLKLKKFKKFYKTFFLKKKIKLLKKILIKKNLFFKKYYDTKILVSRRLINILRKNKKTKFFKRRKKNKNYFFFKKFFLKTLLKSRELLKKIFSLDKKVRQKRLTKVIFKKSKGIVCNNTMEYSIYNIILRSHFFFFLKDAVTYIKAGLVYLNGRVYTNHTFCVNKNDILQITIDFKYFKYFKFCKKFFKKKMKLIRLNAYRYYRRKYYQKRDKFRMKKRKYPYYYIFFFIYKLNVPRYLEVDYTILSIIIIKKLDISLHTTYFLNKLFSYKLFNLYNYKKIN